MGKIYTPKQDYKVLVSCFTYNQSKYIEDALNGFAMQKTDFPSVCLVMDDCSTDGEQDVIKAWMERECDMETAEYVDLELSNVILVPHKSNKDLTYAFYLLKRNLWKDVALKRSLIIPWREHCEYEALCEGDDYWIDPLKLQKQVNFLDSHPHYSMCFTGAKVLFDDGFESQDSSQMGSLYKNMENREYQGEELLQNWLVPTASILRRVRVEIKRDTRFMFGDIVIVLSCAAAGKIRCLAEDMVVYRRNANGMSAKSQPLPRSIKHYQAIADVFGDKYKKTCQHLIYQSIASSILTGDSKERKEALRISFKHFIWLVPVSITIVTILVNVFKKRVFKP